MKYLTPIQVLFLHSRVIDETSGTHGVNDPAVLLSALARPQSGFAGQELYPDLYSKTAALLESLIRNHPFVDGNKRTGIAAAGLFLEQNGQRLQAGQSELEALALDVAAARLDLAGIAAWFQSHTGD